MGALLNSNQRGEIMSDVPVESIARLTAALWVACEGYHPGVVVLAMAQIMPDAISQTISTREGAQRWFDCVTKNMRTLIDRWYTEPSTRISA